MDTSDIRRSRLKQWFASRSIPEKEKSYISQLMSGKASFGERAARRLERDYGMGDRYLDALPPTDTPMITIPGAHPVLALSPDDPVPDGALYIPAFHVNFSAGNGYQVCYEEIEGAEPVAYLRDWFYKQRINPANVRRFKVTGDSMEPFLYSGDSILVDISDNDLNHITEGKVYAIRYGNDLRVKRLYRTLDGTLTLRSDNPAYNDELVSPALVQEHISLIGRVRDRSGSGGL